jgi:hypothetical protein
MTLLLKYLGSCQLLKTSKKLKDLEAIQKKKTKSYLSSKFQNLKLHLKMKPILMVLLILTILILQESNIRWKKKFSLMLSIFTK